MNDLPTPFSCRSTSTEDGLVIKPVGEVDLATASHLASEVAAARAAAPARVVLDLSEVTFLDSSGLRVVLGADADLRADGIDFQIVPGGPGVQRVFEVAGLTDHLHFA